MAIFFTGLVSLSPSIKREIRTKKLLSVIGEWVAEESAPADGILYHYSLEPRLKHLSQFSWEFFLSPRFKFSSKESEEAKQDAG